MNVVLTDDQIEALINFSTTMQTYSPTEDNDWKAYERLGEAFWDLADNLARGSKPRDMKPLFKVPA